MHIRLFTNEVAGGWMADDIDQFLGGSEECVVLLSEAFVKSGYDVTVYHNFKQSRKDLHSYRRNRVVYKQRESVHVNEEDILITFKDNLPWMGMEKDAVLKIHWSSEVEMPWDTSCIDAFVCLTRFHASRSSFIPQDKIQIIPHGIDYEALDEAFDDVQPNTMLYCSSPDRGLLQLLSDWGRIRMEHPTMRLDVAYGFDNVVKMHPEAGAFVNSIKNQMRQPGITFHGSLSKREIERLYHKSEYWVLPLSRPESELFCLNAVKARYCGCVPIVNKIGALKDTVGDYIHYKNFVSGNLSVIEENSTVNPLGWEEVVQCYWMPLFERLLIHD